MARKRWLMKVLSAVPIGICFCDLVGSVIKVEGGSMRPTLNPDVSGPSDWVLVDKLTTKLQRRYTRGEVVVLWAPDSPHRQQIIKRLLAVEGDTLLLRPAPGDATTAVTAARPGAASAVDLPQGRCWVEGDNGRLSGDSSSAFGPVSMGLLEGRVTHIVWPPSRMGRVALQPPGARLLHAGSAAAGSSTAAAAAAAQAGGCE